MCHFICNTQLMYHMVDIMVKWIPHGMYDIDTIHYVCTIL